MQQCKSKGDREKQADGYEDNKSNESHQRSQDQEKIYFWRGKCYDAQDAVKQLENQLQGIQVELNEYKTKCEGATSRQEQLLEETRQLRNQLDICETTQRAENERLKEEHVRELDKKDETYDERLLKKDKEIRKREKKIEDLYRDIDRLDREKRRNESKDRECREHIDRLKTQTATLLGDVRVAEEYANEQRSRRKDLRYQLCDALDDKDKLYGKIDALYDVIKELKDENRELRQENRTVRSHIERTKPRLGIVSLFPSSLT